MHYNMINSYLTTPHCRFWLEIRDATACRVRNPLYHAVRDQVSSVVRIYANTKLRDEVRNTFNCI